MNALRQQALLGGGLSANETILFVTDPPWMANVSAHHPLNISWAVTGSLPASLRFEIGGHILATIVPKAQEGSVVVNLPDQVRGGQQVLTLEAVGGMNRFPLSLTQLDSVWGTPAASRTESWLNVQIPAAGTVERSKSDEDEN